MEPDETRHWREFRAWFLRRFPVCAEAGCDRPATDLDHIDGQGPNGPRGYDLNNIRPYCHPHHSQRTAPRSQKRTAPRSQNGPHLEQGRPR